MIRATPEQIDYLLSLVSRATGTRCSYLGDCRQKLGLSSFQAQKLSKSQASQLIDEWARKSENQVTDIHATGDTWHRGDGLDDGESYESRLKAIADRDDIREADIVKRQHATISLAIELMTAELAGMTDGTDPDGVTWRDIEPHASTADLAELICEQHARGKS